MIVYALMVWWFDRYEKEPWPLLIGVFVWGAVPSIILALIVELVLDIPLKSFVEPGLTYNLLGSSVIAPVVEESFKGLAVLVVFLLFYRRFDDMLDGVVYGSIVGFGFAAVENVLYFLATLGISGAGTMFIVIFLRAFLFGLNHALFTSFIGIGFALARTSRSWPMKLTMPVMGFALATAAHAVHNGGAALASVTCFSFLFSVASDWIGVLVLLIIVVLATVQERGWIVKHLADEVGAGLITPKQYRTACSYLERVAERTEALFSGDFAKYWRLGRFHQVMTLLAFRKHQFAAFGDEGGNRAEIERWRGEIAAMQERV
jgi:RsiW-degrading membrane proteinase PrsW (M82 family)